MDIKQDKREADTGTYSASVVVDNTTIKIQGVFELPNPGSYDSLKLALELAIKNQITVYITNADWDAKAANM